MGALCGKNNTKNNTKYAKSKDSVGTYNSSKIASVSTCICEFAKVMASMKDEKNEKEAMIKIAEELPIKFQNLLLKIQNKLEWIKGEELRFTYDSRLNMLNKKGRNVLFLLGQKKMAQNYFQY